MNVSIHADSAVANVAAADLLGAWFETSGVRTVMLAAGNSPLELYRLIGERRRSLSHLHLFALDEYVGVPRNDPRTCGNLIRRLAVEAWGLPRDQYHWLSPVEAEALDSVREHVRRLDALGGLDVLVLGLGQNGHLGFNEPGSAEDSDARVLDLEPISVEANRTWFQGEYAPFQGVTVGMRTILAARRILVLAYGSHKTAAVSAMVEGPRSPACPASLLQGHPEVTLFLDPSAAAGLGAPRAR